MDWSQKIRLRNLQILVRLCEARNMSVVAQEFHLTQPALSKWLKEFEESVGTPLFARQARGVEPLPIALELARQARAIVGRLDRAKAIVEQMKHPVSEQIAIGVSPMVAIVLLPAVLRAFHRAHPKAYIQINEDTLDRLNDQLHSGALDVVIGRIEEGIIPPDLLYRKIGDVPLCLVVDDNHPLAHQPQVGWDEALAYPWIAPPRASPMRKRLELALEAQGLRSPDVQIESSFVHTTAGLIQGTEFVVPLSTALARSLGLSTTLNVPWTSMSIHGSMGVLWRPEDRDDALVRAFVSCVIEEGASS